MWGFDRPFAALSDAELRERMEAVRQEAWRRIGVTPPPPLENPDDVTLEAHCRDVLRLLRSFRDRRGGVL